MDTCKSELWHERCASVSTKARKNSKTITIITTHLLRSQSSTCRPYPHETKKHQIHREKEGCNALVRMIVVKRDIETDPRYIQWLINEFRNNAASWLEILLKYTGNTKGQLCICQMQQYSIYMILERPGSHRFKRCSIRGQCKWSRKKNWLREPDGHPQLFCSEHCLGLNVSTDTPVSL